jgi:hypothetical protein
MDLTYLWSREEFAQLLHYEDLARTVVVEEGGRVAGLVSYYRLEVLGRCRVETGVIDLLAFSTISAADRLRLLRAALFQMAEEGLRAAMLLRGSWYDWWPLLAAGFTPAAPEYYYTANKMEPSLPVEKVRRIQVLWR